MDAITSLQIFLSTCLNLSENKKKILLNNNYVINKKIEDILLKNGCKIKKVENKVVISKKMNLYAIVSPDLEIDNIIYSKDLVENKLQRIYKIVKSYELLQTTVNKLNNFLNNIKNKNLKSLIIKIKKNIKVKKIMYS